MAVARTYEKYPIEGDPFKENGKMYVNVTTPKGSKKVRWYSNAERVRMDKAAGLEVEPMDFMNFNARHAFGFDDAGYITIYKGDPSEIEAWADENHECTRRNLTFGFYTPSRLEIKNLPSTITPIKLKWEDVAAEGDKMKPHDIVSKIVASLVGEVTNSQYQGEIDTWLQKIVLVKNKKTKESHFGTKHTYTLVDDENNMYVWETGAKDYAKGISVALKMKVKEHKEIDGNKVTIVWYCKEC